MELDGNSASCSTGIDLINRSSSHRELYFLIAKFLSGGPCHTAAEVLITELERNEIIPTSVNWLGEPISQDFRTFSSKFDHIGSDHLPNLIDCVKTLYAKEFSSQVTSRSLLSFSTLSLVQKSQENGSSSCSKKCSDLSWSKKASYHNALVRTLQRDKNVPLHPVQAIANRPLTGGGVGHSIIQPGFFRRMGISFNTLGHLSAVYCVCFDITGRYIFTGADDHLIKIWSAVNGRLLCTLRGTSSEIADLAINQENTMLAVASCEKIIRVWCIRTGAPIAVLTGQGGNTTSIFFCPLPRSRSSVRYLASTSSDGSCAFWTYSDEPGEPIVFQQKPTLYLERMRPGNAKMNCSSFSSGGLFMAAGSADNHVRVYHMLATDGPERILEVEHHGDRVDSISWANQGLRFVSGSNDGTALIWRFENACWRYIRLYCSKNLGETQNIHENSKRRPKVTMVAWNRDDSLVLTAVADFMIRVWNSKTGELVRVLKEHNGECFVIEPHPVNPRIVCTAGHDGKIIIWDIGSTDKKDNGSKIYQYYNQLGEGQGHGAIFDCKWAPDGFSIAATDSHGHLMFFSIEKDQNLKFKKLPKELFFHSDYRPLSRDAITNEIVDEQTQTLPHLMPPPFLVDVDGNPYTPELQRMVPGRENMKEEYLVPNVAVSDRGIQEVIEGIPSVPIPVVAVVPIVLAGNARSNIDERIQELAREQGLGGQGANHRTERRGVGHRRSGEVEGVRQSREIWSSGPLGSSTKCIIPPIQRGVQQSSENKRMEHLEAEEKWYHEHLTKYSPVSSSNIGVPAAMGSPVESAEGRSRRIRRLAAQAAERRLEQNEEQAGFSQLEGVARPNPRPQMEISVSQGGPRRQNHQRRVGIGTLNNTVNNRRQRPIRYDVGRILRNQEVSDVENLDLDDSSTDANIGMSSSDSSSSSDSDSDWGGNLRRNGQPQNNRRRTDGEGRTRAARTNSNSSHSDAENEDQEELSPREEIKTEPRPGTSTEITGAKKSETLKNSRPRKARKRIDYSGGLEDIDEPFRPPDWLTAFYPKRSPYFPQLGDDLVYFRQGHETYIKYVEDNNLYQITSKMKKSLPYVLKPDLEAEVSVRVIGVKFELEPPRVVVLKLARVDWHTGELIRNDYLYVKYHDVENVVDFLILRQMYDNSIRRKWNEGDKFRCLIWPDWWIGTIEKNEPKNAAFPTSHYLCYQIKWDNSDIEWMSPWDMDTIPDDFVITTDSEDGIPASLEDFRVGLYEPVLSDWPPHGHQDAQCEKLSHLLEQVMTLAISEAFLTPVDLRQYPDYVTQIEYPVDLSTIKARLDNRFYRRADALKFDVKYIAMNTEKYNKHGSDIVKHAQVVRDVCLELIGNPNITSINPIYQKFMKNISNAEAQSSSDSKKASGSRNVAAKPGKSSQTGSGSSKMRLRGRHSHDSDEEDHGGWEQQCLELLNEIYNKKDAVPFREPVDIITYPSYYQQIDTPMDLGTIREDLLGGNYGTVQSFHKDMLLIFSNSKQYNQERSTIYAMTCRLQSLYECQIKPIIRRKSPSKNKKNKKSQSSSKGSRIHSTRGTSSINSTPRKNPKRLAVEKNRYVINNSDDESSEEEQLSPTRELRTRPDNKRRSSLTQVNGHSSPSTPVRRLNGHSSTTTGNSTPSRNGTTSSRNSTESSGASRTRKVKRFRISSGESPQASPRRVKIKTEAPSPRSTNLRKQKAPIKEEADSDEFEDSEDGINMPTLNKVNDEDYNLTDDGSDEEYGSVRRSTRKRRRIEESDDHGYETRNRGKSTKNYVEAQEASDDDEGPAGKRRRVITSSSPPRSTRSQATLEPPVLKRTARISSDESENEDNQPGPSSRYKQTARKSASLVAPRKKLSSIRNALEDEEEEEEVDSENESESEDKDEENSDQSEDERNSGKMRKSQQRPRRPLRPRQNGSDDDDYEIQGAKKLKNERSPRRPTRGANIDYAEDSESDHEPHEQISVSSRGRLRKTKSYTQD